MKRRSTCCPAPSSACAASATFPRRRAATGACHRLASSGPHSHRINVDACVAHARQQISPRRKRLLVDAHARRRHAGQRTLIANHSLAAQVPRLLVLLLHRVAQRRGPGVLAGVCAHLHKQFEPNSCCVGVDWRPFHACKCRCWLGSNVGNVQVTNREFGAGAYRPYMLFVEQWGT